MEESFPGEEKPKDAKSTRPFFRVLGEGMLSGNTAWLWNSEELWCRGWNFRFGVRAALGTSPSQATHEQDGGGGVTYLTPEPQYLHL